MTFAGKNASSVAGNFRLDGKVAIVTGAGSGIGQAIALRFAANGAAIRIVDINLKQGEAVAAQITAAGGNATAHAWTSISAAFWTSTSSECTRMS